MKIIHTYLNKSTFVKKDIEIFESIAEVLNYEFEIKKKSHLPFSFLNQFLFLMTHIWKTDVIIVQFSGYQAFLPCLFGKVFNKTSIIISGGTDCVSFPKIGYGYFNKSILKYFTKWSYQLCSLALPKHESLWYCEYTYDKSEPQKQGIKSFLPAIKDKYKVITNGYDEEKWPLLNLERKKNSFITLSGAFEYPFQVQLKGIDLILQVAPKFPECTFTIAGVPTSIKLDVLSDNVIILPPIPHDQLPELFNSYKYYMQLSMAEGFPNALCEAMLCGCTPIVSNVFSMPEIVGADGYIVRTRELVALETSLKIIINKSSKEPLLNRTLISERFTFKKRKEIMHSILMHY